MSGLPNSKSEKARLFYDATALTAGDFSLMNYGYAPLEGSFVNACEPERYCLELYRHVLGNTELANRRVLEVSCGRGGGAAFVAASYRPAQYVGIDISEQNIKMANARFAHVPNLTFRVQRAESLLFEPSAFDAVLSVEASHLYDDPARFFSEVHRVLSPEGVFLYADLFWSNSDPERLINEAGLRVTETEDITDHVLQALDLDSERREQIVKNSIPEHLAHDFRSWSGIKGHRAYNRFASREWIYRCFRVQRLKWSIRCSWLAIVVGTISP